MFILNPIPLEWVPMFYPPAIFPLFEAWLSKTEDIEWNWVNKGFKLDFGQTLPNEGNTNKKGEILDFFNLLHMKF